MVQLEAFGGEYGVLVVPTPELDGLDDVVDEAVEFKDGRMLDAVHSGEPGAKCLAR